MLLQINLGRHLSSHDVQYDFSNNASLSKVSRTRSSSLHQSQAITHFESPRIILRPSIITYFGYSTVHVQGLDLVDCCGSGVASHFCIQCLTLKFKCWQCNILIYACIRERTVDFASNFHDPSVYIPLS